jgi:hypothetical protein
MDINEFRALCAKVAHETDPQNLARLEGRMRLLLQDSQRSDVPHSIKEVPNI